MHDFFDQKNKISQRNLLLEMLSKESLASIEPYLTRVALVRSQCLFEDNQPVEYVFFLETGLATLIANTGDNARVQVNMVGWEGFAGTVSLFDGDLMSMHSAEVQIAGSAFRMPQIHFQEALKTLPEFRNLCTKHTKAAFMQTSQLTACNAKHSIMQRLCRFLLMAQDRIGQKTLVITQDELALAQGVRRAGISVAITSLESSGIVRQGHGYIEIIDRSKLIYEACDCYHLIKIRHVGIMNKERSCQKLI